jgi:hypothetical protein
MLELIRSIGDRIRDLVNNRRPAERYTPRLHYSLTLLDNLKSDPGDRQQLMIKGYTRNISESGMALIASTIRINDQNIALYNRKLMIVLELPGGLVRMQAVAVHFRELLGEEDQGYLIGVRILGMNDKDKAQYTRYIERLSRGAKISARIQSSKSVQ